MLYEKLFRGQNNLHRSYENIFDDNNDFQKLIQDQMSELKSYVNTRVLKVTQTTKDQENMLDRQRVTLEEAMKKFEENLKLLN